MDPILRRARPDDAPIIAANNLAMARETEGVDLDPARLAEGVGAVLADPGKGFYLVAETGGRVVGQLMVTFEWSDWRNGTFWWIQSVYVVPEARRTGVYRALYRHLLDAARAEAARADAARAEAARADAARRDGGVCGVRLYVHEHNARARATYAALGMVEAPYRMFEVDFVLDRLTAPTSPGNHPVTPTPVGSSRRP